MTQREITAEKFRKDFVNKLKDAAEDLIKNAEDIAGHALLSGDIKVVIEIDSRPETLPSYKVEREFLSSKHLERMEDWEND